MKVSAVVVIVPFVVTMSVNSNMVSMVDVEVILIVLVIGAPVAAICIVIAILLFQIAAATEEATTVELALAEETKSKGKLQTYLVWRITVNFDGRRNLRDDMWVVANASSLG